MANAPKTRKGERRFSGSIEPGPLGPGPAPLDRTAELPIPQIAPAAKRRRAARERPAPTLWPRRTPKESGSGAQAAAPSAGARKPEPKR